MAKGSSSKRRPQRASSSTAGASSTAASRACPWPARYQNLETHPPSPCTPPMHTSHAPPHRGTRACRVVLPSAPRRAGQAGQAISRACPALALPPRPLTSSRRASEEVRTVSRSGLPDTDMGPGPAGSISRAARFDGTPSSASPDDDDDHHHALSSSPPPADRVAVGAKAHAAREARAAHVTGSRRQRIHVWVRYVREYSHPRASAPDMCIYIYIFGRAPPR